MTDLLAAAAELVDIPSLSHHEGALADRLESDLGAAPWLAVERVGDNVVARTDLGRDNRLILAGHTDTVPPNGNGRARLDGDVLWGLGSADMKAGLAVFRELALTVSEPEMDVTYVFYACEEVDQAHNGLVQLLRDRPDLLDGDAAVLGEPTGGRVEAGCQGTMRAKLVIRGERAHTARPWVGANAIHRLGPFLHRLAGYEGRRPVLDGCEYREALQAVGVEGGVANNVVPDEVTLTLNHRYAPDRRTGEAFLHLVEIFEPLLDRGRGDGLELVADSIPAPPGLTHPLLARLVQLTGRPPAAKLGWTDVSFFASSGIPATNFGPGDPLLAHTAGERVERHDIEQAFTLLQGYLRDDPKRG
ncbi:MAG TPA: succinyl-diaminopimelate desuccinylase [Acidimicrobiales bacterium]